MERPADTVTGGRDDDDNTGRKLGPGTSSVLVVTIACVLLGDRRGGCMLIPHAQILQMVWRKSAMERSETWCSAAELVASGGGGLAVVSGRLATTWSAGGGGGQVRLPC